MLKAFETIGAKLAPKMVKLEAVSPHIAFAAGLVAMVGGTVYLCKQIHDLNENEELNELDEAKKLLDEAEEKIKDGTVQPTEDMNEEVIKEGRRKISWRAKKIIFKKCALAAAIIVVGAGAATGGHILLNNQKKDAIAFGNAAMAMYNGLATRVKEELPKEEAAKLIFGKDAVIGDDTVGGERAVFKDNTIKEDKGDDVPPWSTEYDIIFDAASTIWTPSPVKTHNALRAVFAGLAHRLNTVGHLFYWQAFEALGYSKDTAIKMFGSDAGWVRDLPDGSTGTIDYGAVLDMNDPQTREFINGYEPNVVLHLKPHGMVSDLLKRYDKAKRTGNWEKPFEWRGMGVHVGGAD